MHDGVTNVVVVGLGGQGVLRSSDILADVAFADGCDVKKGELHGMSQRSGVVSSDVRFARGTRVLSPIVPTGEADFVVALAGDRKLYARHVCGRTTLISADLINPDDLPDPRSLNVALMGILSALLSLDESAWLGAIRANLPRNFHEVNEQAFAMGVCARESMKSEYFPTHSSPKVNPGSRRLSVTGGLQQAVFGPHTRP